jgi:hypothetical protein
MDYGQPAAQFLEKDVATAGKKYLGKKVTIKGTVIDVSDPKAGFIHLGNGILCDFSRLPAMASSKKPGDICYIDGILNKQQSSHRIEQYHYADQGRNFGYA